MTHQKEAKRTAKGSADTTEPQSTGKNEGEGNRTAARNYDAATAEYIKSGRSDNAAKVAEAALEGPEKEELLAAEKVGKAGHPKHKSE